jgi:hypothetical protein
LFFLFLFLIIFFLQKWKGNYREPWWAVRASAVRAAPVCRPRRAHWFPVSRCQQLKVTAGPALEATMWWLVVQTIQSRCDELPTPRANLSQHRPNAPGTPLVSNFYKTTKRHCKITTHATRKWTITVPLPLFCLQSQFFLLIGCNCYLTARFVPFS